MWLLEHFANFPCECRFLRVFDMPRAVLRGDIWEEEDLAPALTPVLLTHRKSLASHSPASGKRTVWEALRQTDLGEVWGLIEIRLR